MSDKGNSIGDHIAIGPVFSTQLNGHRGVSPADWGTQQSGPSNPGGTKPVRVDSANASMSAGRQGMQKKGK